MTDQASYPTYLEEAAEELRKAREDNEAHAETIPDLIARKAEVGPVVAEVNNRRMEIAAAFTRLAECQAAMLNAARMPDFPAAAPEGQGPEDPQ
jgi:hypothetical protein